MSEKDVPAVSSISEQTASSNPFNEFYRSAEWMQARFAVLSSNPKCVCCGRSASSGATMTVDHIEPLSKRWDLRLDPSNLQTLCNLCNWGKGSNFWRSSVRQHEPRIQMCPFYGRSLTIEDPKLYPFLLWTEAASNCGLAINGSSCQMETDHQRIDWLYCDRLKKVRLAERCDDPDLATKWFMPR